MYCSKDFRKLCQYFGSFTHKDHGKWRIPRDIWGAYNIDEKTCRRRYFKHEDPQIHLESYSLQRCSLLGQEVGVVNSKRHSVLAGDMVLQILLHHESQWMGWEILESQNAVHQYWRGNELVVRRVMNLRTYGGAAKGMPRNWVVVPTTCPSKDP